MKTNGKKQPFFAGFLENQLNDKTSRSIQGGTNVTTAAVGEDDDNQTQKYPSDCEDDTKPTADMAHTMKYPSDGDDEISPVEM